MASYTHWRESFYGSAWVALDNLSPEDGPQKSLDSKKILKLCRIFALEGCRPDDEGNRLRSVVSRTQLNALREAGLVRKSKALPLLNLTFKVNYVHGRHRIAAAEAFLSEGNQQWVVDFHLEETALPLSAPQLRTRAQDAFENTQPYSDGTILRKLLTVEDDQLLKMWMARLTESKRRDYRQFRRQQRLAPLVRAFESLTKFEGLWHDFKMGTFHRLLTLRCPEELVSYLQTIDGVWSEIARGASAEAIDAYTVRTLQGRAPHLSEIDIDFITKKFDDGYLFAKVKNVAQRADLRRRCLATRRIIPSLLTFLEDTKWLEPSCRILRGLGLDSTLTLRDALYQAFDVLRVEPSTRRDSKFSSAYRKLWLYTLRHFAELDSLQPRLDARNLSLMPKSKPQDNRAKLLGYMYALGFSSPVAANPMQYSGDDPPDLANPCSAESYRGFKLSTRCGRMYQSSYIQNRAQLHYQNVYNARLGHKGSVISCFGVASDIFRAFFGQSEADVLQIVNDIPDVSRISWASICNRIDAVVVKGAGDISSDQKSTDEQKSESVDHQNTGEQRNEAVDLQSTDEQMSVDHQNTDEQRNEAVGHQNTDEQRNEAADLQSTDEQMSVDHQNTDEQRNEAVDHQNTDEQRNEAVDHQSIDEQRNTQSGTNGEVLESRRNSAAEHSHVIGLQDPKDRHNLAQNVQDGIQSNDRDVADHGADDVMNGDLASGQSAPAAPFHTSSPARSHLTPEAPNTRENPDELFVADDMSDSEDMPEPEPGSVVEPSSRPGEPPTEPPTEPPAEPPTFGTGHEFRAAVPVPEPVTGPMTEPSTRHDSMFRFGQGHPLKILTDERKRKRLEDFDSTEIRVSDKRPVDKHPKLNDIGVFLSNAKHVWRSTLTDKFWVISDDGKRCFDTPQETLQYLDQQRELFRLQAYCATFQEYGNVLELKLNLLRPQEIPQAARGFVALWSFDWQFRNSFVLELDHAVSYC